MENPDNTIISLVAEADERSISNPPAILMEPFSKLVNCNVKGNIKLSSNSTVANSIIEKYFAIGNFSFAQRVEFSRYVTIGSRVSIGAFGHPTNWLSNLEFQYRDSSRFYGDTVSQNSHIDLKEFSPQMTLVGNDVLICDHAFIRSGVNIGSGAIIGAGSVVVKDIPPYAIAAGNPSRIIKYRFSSEIIHQLLKLNWWEYDIHQLEGIQFNKIEKAIEQIEEMKIKQQKT